MPSHHYKVVSPHTVEPVQLSHGLLYGQGIFTTFAAHPEQSVFRLAAHYERLQQGCRFFQIPFPWPSFIAFENAMMQFIGQAIDHPQVVRVSLIPNDVTSETDTLFSTRSLPAPQEHLTACTVQFDRLFPQYKHTSHIAEGVYLNEAQAQGYDDYIRISHAGYLTEAAYANLFIVTENNSLLTPDAQQAGCLPGIMRGAVVDACAQMGIPVTEGLYPPEQLTRGVRGVFLSNAVRGLYPLHQVDKQVYDATAIQPLLERLTLHLNYPCKPLQPY
jgi:branched-subunit amino acid aminotransferase/4-amino-4-deoxychorismate lyase